MAEQEIKTGRQGPSAQLIVVIVLVLLGLLFIAQNTTKKRFRYLFWSVDGPAWLWFVALLAIGFVAGLAFPKLRARRQSTD